MKSAQQLSLFGAAPDTGNLGVSALCFSTIDSLNNNNPNLSWNIFDYARGIRQSSLAIGENQVQVQQVAAYDSKRFYRNESFQNIAFFNQFGGLFNPISKCFLNTDTFLDISGGDSFSDIYGIKAYYKISKPKHMVMQAKKNLFLLPQTYGPFKHEECRKDAERIVTYAQFAWARDERSYQNLKDLLGDQFDPNKHHCGVDMAFLLPKTPCPELIPQVIQAKLKDPQHKTVGINVSGLLYNKESESEQSFSIKFSYRKLIADLLYFFKEQNTCVVLVPHVFNKGFTGESDLDACIKVYEAYKDKMDIQIIDQVRNPCQIKWAISQLDFFMGPRMHSTIASLTTAVPTIGLAYSDKMRGIFELFKMGDYVVDMRTDSYEDALKRTKDAFLNPDLKKTLSEETAIQLEKAREQAKLISSQLASLTQG